jgi:cysteine desulfurase
LLKKLLALPAELTINGDREGRVANNINFSIQGANHDYVSTRLSKEGVSVATSTACQSSEAESDILESIPDTPNTGLRVTLGVDTSQEDVDIFISKLQAVITD